MRSALYYPHTELRHASLLKTCLLLWDKLEFVVPFPDYQFHYSDSKIAEAVELIGIKRVPRTSEKREAHNLIEDFATRQLPESFYYFSQGSGDYMKYGMWPQKLLPETWDMLRDLQLAGNPLANSDYPLQDAAGLALMSILADCCAGDTRARVTDRGSAYAALTNLLVDKERAAIDEYQTVVPLTLNIIKSSDIPLDRLLDFRKRELSESGHAIRDLRHRYVDRISAHVKAVTELTKSRDRDNLDEEFELEMADDLRFLRDELRISKRKALLSKEVVVTAIAGIASFLSATQGLPIEVPGTWTLAGSAVTAGGLLATQTNYTSSRIATLQKHPMAYLYELERV
jgi:hypothetical protein